MAGPTWRNVAAPDFSGSLDGLRVSNALLEQAFGGIDKALTGVDNRLTDQARAGYMAELQRFQDAEALQKALAQDPTLGRGMKRLDAKTLADGSQMVDTLLARDTTEAANKKSALDALVAENKIRFAPQMNELIRVSQLQGRTGVNQFLKDKPELVQALEFEKYATSALGVAEKNINVDGTIQDQGIELTNFQNSQTDRAVAQTALATAQRIRESNATGTGVRSAITEIKDPLLKAAVARELERDFPGLYGDALMQGASGGGGSGGGISGAGGTFSGDPLRVVNFEARGRGFAEVPESVKTLGDLDQWGTEVLKGTDGTFSSASGPYQITRNTFRSYAQSALGKNWQSLPNTLENHDKVAAAIFADNKGSNKAIRNQWAALEKLSDADVVAIRKMPWEEARQTIARLESNTDPAAIAGSPAVMAAEAAARNDEDNVTNRQSSFVANLGKNSTELEATGALIKDGAYAKGEEKDVERVLRDIVRRGGGKISVANAADIMRRAPDRDLSDYAMSNSTFDQIFNLKGDYERFIDEEVSSFRSGAKLTGATTAIDRSERVQQIAAAEQQEAQALAEYRLLQQSGRASKAELAAAERKVTNIQSTIRALRVKGQGVITSNPPKDKTTDDKRDKLRAKRSDTPVSDFFSDVLSGNFFSWK